MRLSGAMIQALRDASLRSDGCLCPIRGVRGRAEKVVLDALERRGLIEWTGPVPRISAVGRAAVIGEGHLKSPKWQAHRVRMAVQKAAREAAAPIRAEAAKMAKIFSKGRGKSAWENICASMRLEAE